MPYQSPHALTLEQLQDNLRPWACLTSTSSPHSPPKASHRLHQTGLVLQYNTHSIAVLQVFDRCQCLPGLWELDTSSVVVQYRRAYLRL